MFKFIKKPFLVLLRFSRSLASKCISLNNESIIHIWLVQVVVMEVEILLIYQVEYDLSNKAKDINSKVFNMITRINESKTLKKHISCHCKCKFDDRKCNLSQKRK